MCKMLLDDISRLKQSRMPASSRYYQSLKYDTLEEFDFTLKGDPVMSAVLRAPSEFHSALFYDASRIPAY